MKKKLLALLLSISLIVSLAACAATPVNESAGTGSEQEASKDFTTDVVVIGAGGAGLTAAIEAHDAGANVIIVEKMSYIGGNSLRSKGGLNAAGTEAQKKAEVPDTPEVFYKDTMEGGKNLNNPDLVKYLSENAVHAVEWLTGLGADLSDFAQGGGTTYPRMHRPKGGANIGEHIIEIFTENIEKRGIKLMTKTEAKEILVDKDGKVIGIKVAQGNGDTVSEFTIKADAVVVAAGGFAANEEMYTKYKPEIKGFITTNHPGATGDGILMAEKVGAALVDIEQIQLQPTVEQTTREVVSDTVRGKGAILVNQEGKRFADEMLTRDKLSAAILSQTNKSAYLLFDQKLREGMSAVEELAKLGIVTEGATAEELAEKIGVDGATLKATIDSWNKSVNDKNDAEFGRSKAMDNDLSKAPYYAIKVAPGVHYTMGGIKININAEVIDIKGNVIKGLYAAGEVTGGVHGANRLGGNAVADYVVYGRQAGKNSAAFALADGGIGAKVSDNNDSVAAAPTVKEGINAQYKDGNYSGTSKGHGGEVKVDVLVQDGFIKSIKLSGDGETGALFTSIEKELIPAIIYNQTAEVDSVSGASDSSKAVKDAVSAALEGARK